MGALLTSLSDQRSRLRLGLGLLTITAAISVAAPVPVFAKKDFPIDFEEMKRDGKSLFKATWGRGGRLGTFHDVDADGQLEFIKLDRNKGNLTLDLTQIDRQGPTFSVPVGEGVAAGLVALNLDDDPALEYLVAYGERIGTVQYVLLVGAGAVAGAFLAVPVFEIGAVQYLMVPVIRPNGQIDLYDLAAFDDDGARLWHQDLRDLAAAGQDFRESRFQWVVGDRDGNGATILITDDAQKALIGLSAEDGSVLWRHALTGKARPSTQQFFALADDQRLLPVLFAAGEEILVLDPESGKPLFEGPVDRATSQLPSWRIFGAGDAQGYLVFGENRRQLRMLSLTSGEVLWSLTMPDTVLDIVPLSNERFIAVSANEIRLVTANGIEQARYDAPATIKAKFPPVYRDLNDDGVMELVFVSGKKLVCWRPETGEKLWETSLFGLTGGANPVQLYSEFHDINGDGWLDVPGKKGGGWGQWLSGRTGEVLAQVGNGATPPVVGDWDGDGKPEIFWWKTWYEVP